MVLQDNSKINCWIVTEGLTGTENQCIGVANALAKLYAVECSIRRISLRQPWKMLSPYLGLESSCTFTPALTAPWPDILITSGRKAVAAARYVKRKSHGKTFTLHIQDPRIHSKHFDLLAVPEHDPVRGVHVITTLGAPNKITDEKLLQARQDWAHAFATLPAPRVAVLIGGTSKAYRMTEEITHTLAQNLGNLLQSKTSLMITTSRRTGAENESILRSGLGKSDHLYFWDGTGENPYMGLLAWADYILVTADSTSMLSDAATTGKPVYMINLDGGKPRIKAMQENFIKAGILRHFDGQLEHWTYTPLRDADKIATDVYNRLKNRS